MDRKPKNIMLKAYDFSDVLLLKRRFYLTCVIIRDLAIAANLEFGAIRTIIIIIIIRVRVNLQHLTMHLTVESYTVVMLLTFILIIISILSPLTASFQD